MSQARFCNPATGRRMNSHETGHLTHVTGQMWPDPCADHETRLTRSGNGPRQRQHSGSDTPAWISHANGDWVRNVSGPGGGVAVQQSDTGGVTTAVLRMSNPHGDVVASAPLSAGRDVTAADVQLEADFDEYGVNLTTTAQPPAPGYGWVGKAARATTMAGLMVMGARFYNPATGRFLSTDPAPGGNPNPYTYPPDPVNGYDLDGNWSIGGAWNAVTSAVTSTVRAAASTVSRAWQGAKTVYHAVRATATRVVRTVVRATRTVYRAAKTVARKVVDKVRAGASPRRRARAASLNTSLSPGGPNYGDLAAGAVNVIRGAIQFGAGHAALNAAPAAAAAGPEAAIAAVVAGYYNEGVGLGKMARGARQINSGLTTTCAADCDIGGQARDFFWGVVPLGGFLRDGSDWLDKWGSLP